MYGLFWKIFLWFWLAMLAMGATIAWTVAYLGQSEIPTMISRAHEQFTEDTDKAFQVLQRQGIAGLKQWMEEPEHRRSMNLYLLDMSGRVLVGGAIPGHLSRFAFAPPGREFHGRNQADKPHVISRSVVIPGQGFFRVIAEFRPPHPIWRLLSPLRLLVVLLVSGLVCFGLARYLSTPVRKLRTATRKLAAGELSTRVASEFGRRRDEIADLGHDFDHMAEHLQSLLEAQQQLLSDISHELRSPLARLQVALGLVRQRAGEQGDGELDRIEREAERLNELIGQILSLTRLSSPHKTIAKEPVNLVELLESLLEDASFEAESAHRHVAIIHREPVVINGDAQLLHSAIENVVRNGLRYTREGTRVELSLQREGKDAMLRVRDYGPGVADSELPTIFDPFVRADEARDRDSGGYGLGLSIAKRVIELHGGSIEAENVAGGGLQVIMRLPVGQG